MSPIEPSERVEPPTPNAAIISPGHEIAYYDYASASAQPEATILFAHAASFHGRIWDQTIRHLSNDFRCLSFDFYGHGRSSGSAGDHQADLESWATLFDDISPLLDQVGIEGRLLGAGHSLGGAGLFTACLQSADLFDGLWAYEPVVFRNLDALAEVGESMAQRAETRRDIFDDANQAFSWFADRPPFTHVDPTVLSDYVEHGVTDHSNGVQLRCTPTVEASVYRLGGGLNLFNAVADIQVPTLLAVGGQDPMAQKLATDLSQVLGSSQVELFDQLSHLGPLERPDIVAASIRQFLSAKV